MYKSIRVVGSDAARNNVEVSVSRATLTRYLTYLHMICYTRQHVHMYMLRYKLLAFDLELSAIQNMALPLLNSILEVILSRVPLHGTLAAEM